MFFFVSKAKIEQYNRRKIKNNDKNKRNYNYVVMINIGSFTDVIVKQLSSSFHSRQQFQESILTYS